jgi:pimeloyl-ACP methyl ester carboxylesterase
MKRLVVVVLLAVCVSVMAGGQTKPASKAAVKYGSNAAAGHTFTHDGVKLYYEVYGKGEPLLIIHGNGGSISDVRKQIEYFRKKYKVIAMDSRDQGKSADSQEKLTYEKMTDDLAALLDHVKAGPAYVLGWSDGGIEALLLAVRHPGRVKKVAAMAANLNPTDQALHPETIQLVKDWLGKMTPEEKATPAGRREVKVTGMMLTEPNIDPKALEAISAPTLVLAGDHDLIGDEHTLEIYHHIPNSELIIFPGATHMIPFDDPATFNAAVERFFSTPFVKVQRIPDTMKSLEKLRGGKTE